MIQPRTVKRDKQILFLYFEEAWKPEAIVLEMKLANVWIVYNAIKRAKKSSAWNRIAKNRQT